MQKQKTSKEGENERNLLCGTSVSCVDTMMALSRADSKTVKHTKLSSRGMFTVRTKVNRRTQCGSVRGSLNLSTQNQLE